MIKKLLILSALSLFLGLPSQIKAETSDVYVQEKTQEGPGIVFVEKEHNFGIIEENGGPVSYKFEFTNTGDSPLVIISATASCGCTRPTYPTEPIAPGKKGTIKVTYLPEGRPGEFEKVIKVRTNVKDSKKISLRINGTVCPK